MTANTSLSRWNPFDDLRAMRNMMLRPLWPFERALAETGGAAFENVALDVFEQDGQLVVKAAVPGVKKDDIEVTVQDGVLQIRAEKKEEKEVKEDNYYLKECSTGLLSRSVRLPADVEADAIKANYADGVLTLSMPKSRTTKAKQIPITGEDQPRSEQASHGAGASPAAR